MQVYLEEVCCEVRRREVDASRMVSQDQAPHIVAILRCEVWQFGPP